VLLQLVVRAIKAGDKIVLADALRVGQYKEGETIEVQDLANRLFHSVFMGTENSSGDTRSRYICTGFASRWDPVGHV
jgi:NAD+ synthase (glutamine-hydrolysing)